MTRLFDIFFNIPLETRFKICVGALFISILALNFMPLNWLGWFTSGLFILWLTAWFTTLVMCVWEWRKNRE